MVLRLLYATPFGINDPIFSRDIGFYVFTLPALSGGARLPLRRSPSSRSFCWCRSTRSGATSCSHRAATALQVRSSPRPGMHLAALLAALFLITALRLWLVDIPSLLYSTTGPLVGASYTDLHASLPAFRISAVVAVLAAVAVISVAMRRQLGRYALLAIGGYLAVGVRRPGAASRLHAEVRGGAHRADPGDAVSPLSHRGHPAGVGAGQRGDPGAGRRAPT